VELYVSNLTCSLHVKLLTYNST